MPPAVSSPLKCTHSGLCCICSDFVVFFTESLSALEDKDLDALMADLVADLNDVEQKTLQALKTSGNQQSTVTEPSRSLDSGYVTITGQLEDDLPPPPPDPNLELPLPPPPPPPPPEPLTQVSLDGTFVKFCNDETFMNCRVRTFCYSVP